MKHNINNQIISCSSQGKIKGGGEGRGGFGNHDET